MTPHYAPKTVNPAGLARRVAAYPAVGVIVAAITGVLLLVGAGAANAEDPAAPAPGSVTTPVGADRSTDGTVSLAAASGSSTTADTGCASTLFNSGQTAATATADCQVTTSWTVTAAAHPTAAQVAALGLSPAAAGTVWYRHWSESKQSVLYAWKEVHSGLEYWTSLHVWERHTFDGYTGYHNCHVNGSYAYGYSISQNACYTSPTLSEVRVTSWDNFEVSALIKGFPLSRDYSMHVNMHPGGGIYFY